MRRFGNAVAIMTVCCLLVLPCYGEPTETKAYGEERSEQTLLYAIRPKESRGSNSVAMDLFADTTFLLRLRGNSYGFVHVQPGRHRIWGTGDLEEIDFIAGETFYLLCGDQGMALLDDEEGRAFLESVRYYMPPDPEVEAKRSKKEAKAAKAMPKIDKLLAKRTRVGVYALPFPVRPESVEGLLHVPLNARIEIELMENTSSFLNELGETIWFRVREDAAVDGQVWLPRGTPLQGTIVEVKHGRGGGASGDIEIEFSQVETPDGTVIPLIGQLIDTGRDRTAAASRALVAGGLLGAMFVKGREAFGLRGEGWHVWTRAEAWVSPQNPRSAPQSEVAGPVEVTARFVEKLAYNLEKHKQIPEIALEVETDTVLKAVALMAVGDWTIPDPPQARQLSRKGETNTWTILFDGWSLLRHLAAGDRATPLRFKADTADGRTVIAEAEISWLPKRPG